MRIQSSTVAFLSAVTALGLLCLDSFGAADSADKRFSSEGLHSEAIEWPRITSVFTDVSSTTLTVAGEAGFGYMVQASTNLADWARIGWVVGASNGLFQFVDVDGQRHWQRFYRAERLRLPEATFAVFTDPHYMHPSLVDVESPAFQTYVTQDQKMLKESHAILHSVIESIAMAAPDIVLIPGDLTKDGELVSHQGVTNALRRLRDAGAKVFVCPGNHDVNNPHAVSYTGENVTRVPSVSAAEFAQIYDLYGYGDAIARDPASLSYVAEPLPGLWILAMDACRYDLNNDAPFTGGYFDADRWAWITNQLALGLEKGKMVLGLVHHGVIEHYVGQKLLFSDYLLDDCEAIGQTFASHGMRVVFTGHYHAQDIVQAIYLEGTLFDVETGSTVTYPCPYRLMHLTGDGVLSINSYQVTNIDFDLGGQDFPSYAYGFLTNRLMDFALNHLTEPPYDLPQDTAVFIAPAMTEAFASHSRGDESSRPISAQTRGIIAHLQGQTDDFMARLMASVLLTYFEDPPPRDNALSIDLVSGSVALTSPPLANAFAGPHATDPILKR